MFGVEHVVDGGQGDVLIDAAIAGDEVGVQELVVIKSRVRRRSAGTAAYHTVGIGQQKRGGLARASGTTTSDRTGVMGDVGEEVATGANGERGVDRRAYGAYHKVFVARVGNAVRISRNDLR